MQLSDARAADEVDGTSVGFLDVDATENIEIESAATTNCADRTANE
jgi:hypothetical protein